MVRPVLNILWIILGGGIILFFEYLIGGIFLCITIIGIPFGLQKFKLAFFALTPFGSKVVESENSGGCLVILFNIFWIFSFGLAIALTHLILALLYGITIIGIPFATQHIKMAGLAIAPFGKTII
jgi:uncharacterized membrane protein YccF (DUF307 family)